jgi:hypothetical protein
LRSELNLWPLILFGIFGIIIFSIPYHGWAGGAGPGEISTPC